MQTKEQVTHAFKAELQALLDKYGAELEAKDFWQGYAECGEDAAMPTPPVARPTPEPKTPPATPPIAAPAALIAPVADAPAATIPAADAAEPPAIAAPIAMFSAFFVAGFFSSSCVGSDIVTSIWKKSALVGRHYFFHSPSFSGLGKEIVPFSLSRTQRRTEYEFP